MTQGTDGNYAVKIRKMLAAGEQRLIVNLNDLRIFQAQLATEYLFEKCCILINLNNRIFLYFVFLISFLYFTVNLKDINLASSLFKMIIVIFHMLFNLSFYFYILLNFYGLKIIFEIQFSENSNELFICI